MEERRQLPRWRIGKAARLTFGNGGPSTNGHITDIHLKGMSVGLPEPLCDQGPFGIRVVLGDDCRFDVEAEVKWTREENGQYVHGLVFSKILEDSKDRIYAYISEQCLNQFHARWWSL